MAFGSVKVDSLVTATQTVNIDEVVLKTGTQTLTNKTLTSPILTTPALGTPTSGTLTNCTFPTFVTAGTGINVVGTQVQNTGVLSVNGNTGAVTNIATTNASQTYTANQTFAQTQTYPRIPANTQSSAYTLVLSDAGKVVINSSGGVTVPSNVFTAGDVISIYNNSGSDIALNQGGSVTMYKAGSATTGNQLIAQRGIGVVLCVASNEFVCSGVK